MKASYISFVIKSKCFHEASVFNWLYDILLPFCAIHFLEIVLIIENYMCDDMIATLNCSLVISQKKIKQLLSFTYGLVNNRYVYLYRSLVKGIIVTVNIYNILIVKGNIAKVEVIFSHIYCPPVPLLMGVA